MSGLAGWSLSIIAGSEMRPQLKHAAAQIATNEFNNADQIAMETVEGRSKSLFVTNLGKLSGAPQWQ